MLYGIVFKEVLGQYQAAGMFRPSFLAWKSPACSLKSKPASRLHLAESPTCSLKSAPASRLHLIETPACSLKSAPTSRLHLAEVGQILVARQL